MKTRLSLTLLTLLILPPLLLLLTGCATLQLNVRVAPDGTGEKEMVLTIDRDILALAAAAGRDPLNEAQARLGEGFQITRHEIGREVGFKAVQPFRGSLELTEDPWQGTFTQRNSFFFREYELALDADLNFGDDDLTPMLLSQVDVSVSVEVPGRVEAHNGQADSSGNRITWNLVPGRKEHLTLRARQYHADRLVAAAGGLLLLAGGLGWMAFGRKKG